MSLKTTSLLLISLIISAQMNQTNPEEFVNRFSLLIEEAIHSFSKAVVRIVSSLTEAITVIARSLYVCLIVLGLILRFTRIDWRMGGDLIKGGIALAILTELILPLIL